MCVTPLIYPLDNVFWLIIYSIVLLRKLCMRELIYLPLHLIYLLLYQSCFLSTGEFGVIILTERICDQASLGSKHRCEKIRKLCGKNILVFHIQSELASVLWLTWIFFSCKTVDSCSILAQQFFTWRNFTLSK